MKRFSIRFECFIFTIDNKFIEIQVNTTKHQNRFINYLIHRNHDNNSK